MERLQLLTVFLMLSALSFGQNFSFTGIIDPITPDPIIGSQEVFRFETSLVTQLGQGSANFGFNQQWFSIGKLSTATQNVYGIRFQLPNRAVTLGYQDIGDTNPRIQWIGTGENLGDLEFRSASSFMNTNSNLVATMREDGGTVFGAGIIGFEESRVGII